eukprot:TRINITY_DN1412_c0_g1_i7.p1 TRINITY_DN1412_c0_g1~~TRINITY_DN1412_c0_g1_i7.p1  ORF type:complete len:287 (+),score=62.95 TRINITY_DN1412_c0_g1_i7:55-915(+)
MSHLLFLVIAFCVSTFPAVSADCNACCVSINASCSAAFNGAPGKCCGRDATNKPYCCPANAYCVTGTASAPWQCSYTPPPTTGCSACCGGGSCSTAYNGQPGMCCGKVYDTTYCCPSGRSVCVKSTLTGAYACESTGGTTGSMSGGIIAVIVIACIVACICCAVAANRARTTYFIDSQPGVVTYAQPAYAQPAYGAPVYGAPVYGAPGYYQPGYSGGAVVGAGAAGFATGVIVGNAMSDGGYHHHHHHYDSGWSDSGNNQFFSASTGYSAPSFAADSGNNSFAAGN